MAAVNAVNNALVGATGTGAFVGETSATLITPVIGVADGTSLLLSGAMTPGQEPGIIGTTTNNNANAGSVGEYVSSIIETSSAISLSSLTNTNITSISLSAGDWQVWGNTGYNVQTDTNVVILFGWISSTSASLPNNAFVSRIQYPAAGVVTGAATTIYAAPCPSMRMSLSSVTTIYLSVRANFSVNTLDAFGGIYARRMR